jgi:hypothetical protein
MLGSGQTIEGKTGEEQSQEHVHHFLWHQGDCSQIIRPGKPNSQFCILLSHFTAAVSRFVKTSSRNMATKDMAAASWQCTAS